eukprot:CAMPEP_0172753154 /NCGR_PEP_ID=MMETSP1074-20121228/155337_1 /TAXON_ID=2916 /ORGANISM="Ceratium fusus, Strain PA161109" /LENGTH=101 /DNA_ID=CAMNT_0013585765 /DNA_START=104 /DNA_END=409 /DNA_ORIENTATION=-
MRAKQYILGVNFALSLALVATGATFVGRLSLDVVGSKVCVGVVAITAVVVVVLTMLVESSWSLEASAICAATVSKKLALGVVAWQSLPAKSFKRPGPKTTS